jgi:hypothetical protein
MKYIFIYIFVSIFFAYGCSTCKKNIDVQENEQVDISKSPNVIQQNLSIVTAEILNIKQLEGGLYQISALITSEKSNDIYPSLAAAGNKYLLVPGYQYDGELLLYNDVNRSLLELRAKPVGTKFDAEIFLDNKLGWVIQKVNN